MSSEPFNHAGYAADANAGYFQITSDHTMVDEAVGHAYFDLSMAPAASHDGARGEEAA